jgi:hypothetical protein
MERRGAAIYTFGSMNFTISSETDRSVSFSILLELNGPDSELITRQLSGRLHIH